MKRILVCGGRDFSDWQLFQNAMRQIGWFHIDHGKPDSYGSYAYDRSVTIISGGARGADRMAMEWAVLEDVLLEIYTADWNLYGKSAGYRRNTEMLKEGKPELVIAFPGGVGTSMMIKIAREANVMVFQVRPTTDGFTYGEPDSEVIKAGAEEYEMIMAMMEEMDDHKQKPS